MTTNTLTKPKQAGLRNGQSSAPDETYWRLARRFPLRRLRDQEDYDQALELYSEITRGPEDERAEGEVIYAGTLGVLLESYERHHSDFGRRPLSPARMIAHLMGERGMAAEELDGILGRPAAAVLAEEEEVGEADARKLSDHFGVSAVLFT